MEPVFETPRYRVYDDVLDDDAFARLWTYIQREDYRGVHAQGWLKAWRLGDGEPLAGPTLFSNAVTARLATGQPTPPGQAPPGTYIYPSRRPLDLFASVLLRHHPAWVDLLGEHGRDWVGFTARAFLYPAGTSLSWHLDSGRYAGAFSYYAHPTWNVGWGGELMIADDDDGAIYHPDPAQRVGQHLDNTFESERLMRLGAGRYICAKPNRLVVLGRGAAHAVNKVHAAAGDHVRCAITGFFLCPPQKG